MPRLKSCAMAIRGVIAAWVVAAAVMNIVEVIGSLLDRAITLDDQQRSIE